MGKAYGPYQARKLRQENPALAVLNNENYVWFALVSAPIDDYIHNHPESNELC